MGCFKTGARWMWAVSWATNRFTVGIIDKHLPSDQKIDFKLLIGQQMTGVGIRYTF